MGSPSGRSLEVQTPSHGLVVEDGFLSSGVERGRFSPYPAPTGTTGLLLLLRAMVPSTWAHPSSANHVSPGPCPWYRSQRPYWRAGQWCCRWSCRRPLLGTGVAQWQCRPHPGEGTGWGQAWRQILPVEPWARDLISNMAMKESEARSSDVSYHMDEHWKHLG